MPDEFGGFPAASQQFLAELAANNRREWFQEQRERYQRDLLAPAQAFCVALGERTVRVPAGYAAEHPRAEWLKYKNLYAAMPPIPAALIPTPELVEHCSALCEGATPLFAWLVAVQASART